MPHLSSKRRAATSWAADAQPRPAARRPRSEAHAALRAALGASDALALQDISACTILSEAVYKAVDHGQQAAAVAVRRLEAMVPLTIGLRLRHLSFSPDSQRQRYLMAEADDAIYVSFLGTKFGSDMLTNLDLKRVALLDAPGAAAHRGYLRRVDALPISQLFALAAAQGKRLVLTGHSMCGAVAVLAALRLLSRLPPELHSSVKAIGFATPPLGNAALAAAVRARGWKCNIISYTLPEDWVPGTMSLWSKSGELEEAAEALWQGRAPLAVAAHGRVCCDTGAPSSAACAA